MILIILLTTVLGGVLVWALYAEDVPPRPHVPPRPLDASMSGAELARHDFPLVPAGYDPRQVDAHLRRLGRLHDQMRGAGRGGDEPRVVPRSVLDD